MKVYLVAPVPLGALMIGWAVGWGTGALILIATCLSLGFGVAFWWCWDAWQMRRRERQH
jgi:protein-S-isoprenylcysteine O-methyltransferase Ste14